MDSTSKSTVRSGGSLSAYFMPHSLLEAAAEDDTAEMRMAKARKNNAWLRRWLPVYLQRWAMLFLAFWFMATLAHELDLPPALGWAFSFAQGASVYSAAWLTVMYLRNRLTSL